MIGIPVIGSIYQRTQQWRMKRRAERLISLDRIARATDTGVNQLSVSASEGAMIGRSPGPMKREWRISVHFRANDGGRSTGDEFKFMLDGTDNIRAAEDQMIKLIQNQHLHDA